MRLTDREIELWSKGSIIECATILQKRLNEKRDFTIPDAIDIAEMWLEKQKDLEEVLGIIPKIAANAIEGCKEQQKLLQEKLQRHVKTD